MPYMPYTICIRFPYSLNYFTDISRSDSDDCIQSNYIPNEVTRVSCNNVTGKNETIELPLTSTIYGLILTSNYDFFFWRTLIVGLHSMSWNTSFRYGNSSILTWTSGPWHHLRLELVRNQSIPGTPAQCPCTLEITICIIKLSDNSSASAPHRLLVCVFEWSLLVVPTDFWDSPPITFTFT